MIINILVQFIEKNWLSFIYSLPLFSLFLYLLIEWKAAYGLNNLGKIVAVPVGQERKVVNYNKENCARAKFLEGKDLSINNREIYGDIYIQRSGTSKEVVLTTPKQLMEYYGTKSKNHSKVDSFGAGAFLVTLLGECLGFQNGVEWLRMRKAFDPFFTHKAAVESFPTMVEFISRWVRNFDHAKLNSIDPLQLVSDLPFTCIAKYLYGNELSSEEFLQCLKDLIPAHSELMHYSFLTIAGRFKIFQYLPSKKMRQVSQFQRKFVALSLEQVELSRTLKKETVVEQLYRHVETGKFTLNNWIQTIDEILFANIEVTSTIMAWALVEMGKNPNEQEKLRDEIFEANKISKVHAEEKGTDMEQYIRSSGTFLQYCVLETLRMHPLLWYSFPEISSEELLIDGVKIFPNVPVVVDQYQINYNSPLWNPPDKPKNFGTKYCPSRFENISLRDAMYSQVTFGAGPRKCLGKNFAELLIRSELAYILSKFKVALTEKVEYSKNTFVVQPKTRIQLIPVDKEL